MSRITATRAEMFPHWFCAAERGVHMRGSSKHSQTDKLNVKTMGCFQPYGFTITGLLLNRLPGAQNIHRTCNSAGVLRFIPVNRPATSQAVASDLRAAQQELCNAQIRGFMNRWPSQKLRKPAASALACSFRFKAKHRPKLQHCHHLVLHLAGFGGVSHSSLYQGGGIAPPTSSCMDPAGELARKLGYRVQQGACPVLPRSPGVQSSCSFGKLKGKSTAKICANSFLRMSSASLSSTLYQTIQKPCFRIVRDHLGNPQRPLCFLQYFIASLHPSKEPPRKPKPSPGATRPSPQPPPRAPRSWPRLRAATGEPLQLTLHTNARALLLLNGKDMYP